MPDLVELKDKEKRHHNQGCQLFGPRLHHLGLRYDAIEVSDQGKVIKFYCPRKFVGQKDFVDIVRNLSKSLA
jgi:hypothetical protein